MGFVKETYTTCIIKERMNNFNKLFNQMIAKGIVKPRPKPENCKPTACDHRRKKRFGKSKFIYCCADCGYHFVNGDSNYSHPNQYKGCRHLHKERINDQLTCLRCGLMFDNVLCGVCEHRHKKRFFDYSNFYCCVDCEYHFVDGDPNYSHPNQYKGCNHPYKERINDQLTCLSCGLRFDGFKRTRFTKSSSSQDYEYCNHSHREEDNGTIFCINCGLVDRVALQNSIDDLEFGHHLSRKDQMPESEPRSETTPKPGIRTKTKTITTKPKPTPIPVADLKPIPEHASADELREIARERGIKYYTRMSKKQL